MSLQAEVLGRFEDVYPFPDGTLPIHVDPETGQPAGQGRLIADLGDVAPYLSAFGRQDLADGLFRSTQTFMQGASLVRRNDGKFHAFDNHDLLVGLIGHTADDNHEWLRGWTTSICNEVTAARVHGLLPRRWPQLGWIPCRTSGFAMGYSEALIDAGNVLDEPRWVEVGIEMAHAWMALRNRHTDGGLIRRILWCQPYMMQPPVLQFGSDPIVRLTKDNTHAIHSLISAYAESGAEEFQYEVAEWIGAVHTVGERSPRGIPMGIRLDGAVEDDLRAHAAFIECVVEAARVGIIGPQEGIASVANVVEHLYPDGLTDRLPPLTVESEVLHLDASVDLVASLWLAHDAGLFPSMGDGYGFVDACSESIVRTFRAPRGYYTLVDPVGPKRELPLAVKYQSLMLKLAVMSSREGLLTRAQIRALLKDR